MPLADAQLLQLAQEGAKKRIEELRSEIATLERLINGSRPQRLFADRAARSQTKTSPTSLRGRSCADCGSAKGTLGEDQTGTRHGDEVVIGNAESNEEASGNVCGPAGGGFTSNEGLLGKATRRQSEKVIATRSTSQKDDHPVLDRRVRNRPAVIQVHLASLASAIVGYATAGQDHQADLPEDALAGSAVKRLVSWWLAFGGDSEPPDGERQGLYARAHVIMKTLSSIATTSTASSVGRRRAEAAIVAEGL